MKRWIVVFYIIANLSVYAQHVIHTQVFLPTIKTLQIGIQDQKFLLPNIELNGTDKLQIRFDEMSHETHAYSYRVFHCNADWTLSSLNTNEYLNGFTSGNIARGVNSLNTTYLYTNYSFSLPNDEMSFKISGNYVVMIYEDNQMDKPVAQACFSIVEPKVKVSATVRGNTDTELNGKVQQLDFEVDLSGYAVREPAEEIKVVVRQNNRMDNEVSGLKPTYFSSNRLSYINNKALIFEGGSEYHRFDFSSVYAAGEGVASIKFSHPHYDVYLYDNVIKANQPYIQDMDVNGKYVVHLQRANDDISEADYMLVHFNLPAGEPFFDGQLYLGGEFNYNLTDENNRLKYDFESKTYTKTILLKQGGYNYQYWFVPKGEHQATTRRVDGSYWQTHNEYTIYVYHRPWGERYDKLVCVKGIEN
jgi:hypothetical protein